MPFAPLYAAVIAPLANIGTPAEKMVAVSLGGALGLELGEFIGLDRRVSELNGVLVGRWGGRRRGWQLYGWLRLGGASLNEPMLGDGMGTQRARNRR